MSLLEQAFRWLGWTTSKAVFEREIDPVARAGDARAALPVVAIVGDVDSERQPRHVQAGESHVTARIGTELGLLAAVDRFPAFCQGHMGHLGDASHQREVGTPCPSSRRGWR